MLIVRFYVVVVFGVVLVMSRDTLDATLIGSKQASKS